MSTAFDPTVTGTDIVLSNSNRTATGGTVAGFHTAGSTTSKYTGKGYIEFKVVTVGGSTSDILFGLDTNPTASMNTFPAFGGAGTGDFVVRLTSGLGFAGGTGVVEDASKEPSPYTAINTDVMQWAVDFDAGKAWFGYNNTYFADPALGLNPTATFTPGSTPWFAVASMNGSSGPHAVTLQAATVDQSFSPPTGFSAWDSLSAAPTYAAFSIPQHDGPVYTKMIGY